MATMLNLRSLVAFLLLIVAMMSSVALARRTCFVGLRLKTNSGHVEKDIKDFTTKAFLGSCSRIKKDCPGKLLEHVKNIFGPDVNNMRGNTAVKMCELFGREILPSQNSDVDVKYKASGCGNEGYMGIGTLCCFKCQAGPHTFYHPIDNCAPTSRPSWCLQQGSQMPDTSDDQIFSHPRPKFGQIFQQNQQ